MAYGLSPQEILPTRKNQVQSPLVAALLWRRPERVALPTVAAPDRVVERSASLPGRLGWEAGAKEWWRRALRRSWWHGVHACLPLARGLYSCGTLTQLRKDLREERLSLELAEQRRRMLTWRTRGSLSGKPLAPIGRMQVIEIGARSRCSLRASKFMVRFKAGSESDSKGRWAVDKVLKAHRSK